MIDAIKTFGMMNLQSHNNTVIELKRTGVHRIAGEGSSNSSGKSVFMKAMDALFTGENLNKHGRDALIRDGHDFGIVTMTSYNGITFSLYLHLEQSKCYYELSYQGKKVRKYLSDDYKQLLKVMNFHYLEEEKWSLNRYKTKTNLPLVSTGGRLNYKILDSSSEDPEVRKVSDIIDEKLTVIKNHKEATERKVISLTEQLKIIEAVEIETTKKQLLYVEATYDNYRKLKPIRNKLKELVKVDNELIKNITFNPNQYEQLSRQLTALLSLTVNLNTTIQSQEQINKHTNTKHIQPNKAEKQLHSIQNIHKIINTINQINENQIQLEKPRQLEIVNLTNQIHLTDTLGKLYHKLDTITELKYKQEITKETKEPNKVLPIQIDNLIYLNNLSKMIPNLMRLGNQIQETNRMTIGKNTLTIKDSSTVLLSFLNNLESTINSTTGITEVTNQLKNIKQQLDKLSEQIGVCEECGCLLTESHKHVN